MKRALPIVLLPLLLALSLAPAAHAATGCSLRNPHTDIRAFFPGYTDFVVQYLTFARQHPSGSAEMMRALDDALDPMFETEDVPYTLYTVRGQGETLGFVYGTNQRGRHGNLQVIAVTDAAHVLQRVHLQTLRSPHREALLDPAYLAALAAEPLDGWPRYADCYARGQCAGVPVADPTGGPAEDDHRAILRALAKLSLLRTGLLRPGQPVAPRDAAALAESIGNHEAIELSRESDRAWGFAPIARGGLAPDEPVLLVRRGGRTTAYPASALRRVPALRDGPLLISWSETTGTASVLQTDRALVPTADVLFDLRLLRDPSEGGTWAPVLGRSVAGPAAHAPQVPALLVPASVASAAAPWASLWTGAPAPPARSAVRGPRALLVERSVVPVPPRGGLELLEGVGVVQTEASVSWVLGVPEGLDLTGLQLDGDLLVHPATGRRWTRLGRAVGSMGPDLNWPVQALLPATSAAALARP